VEVWRAFFPLSVFLGLRRNELLTLRWVETTQRYAHLDLEPVRQAREQTTLLMVAANTASHPN